MFKSGRWRAEKKIKVLFGMQFQATQVPQLKAKNLMISLVPADVGKPTVRLGKAAIVEGNCNWENPIYETVKLVKETKTGTFKEKIYYLIVSSGSSKKGFLGETYIDFADFAEATGPLMLSLPLQASNSGAILHVTVQRMQPNPDQSTEVHEDPTDESNAGSLEMEAKDCDRDGNGNLISTQDKNGSKMLPWSAQDNKRDNDPPLDHESPTQDLANLGPYFIPQKVAFESENPERYGHCRSLTDWSSESASDGSIMETTKGSQDNYRKDTFQEASHNINDRLENRIKVLERQVEVSELEIQSLRKQMVKESKRGQDLSKQVCSLKEERDALRTKYEQLKLSPKFIDDAEVSNDSPPDTENLRAQLEDIKKEVQHEQHLNKKLRFRLQKTEDSNSELILAVRDLNEKLNQKNKQVSRLSSKDKSDQNKDMKAPGELFEGHNGADEAAELKQKIEDLYSEIEVYRKDKEELRIHVEHLSLDYETLRKENDDILSNFEKNQIEKNNIQQELSESLTIVKQFKLQVERLEEDIQKGELQYSESLKTIKELETQIKSLEKELEQQALDYEDDLEVVTRAKIEQENRAIQAEEALRKTKGDNAYAVECLQEEFRKISVEMASKIDENEKISTEAAAEADDLRLKTQILEELLQKTKDELSLMKEQYERKIERLNLVEQGYSEDAEHKGIFSNEKEYLKGSVHASEILKRLSKEKEELEIELANVKKEAETLLEQSVTMKALLDEKKKTEETFHSEMGKFRVQYDELNHHSTELKSENENLQMQVIRLRTNLRKSKEENMSRKQAEAQRSSNSPGKIKRNMINIEELEKSTEGYKPLKALTTNGRSLEEGKGLGERMNSEETSITDGMPAQNGYGTPEIRCEEIQSRGVAKKNNGQTSNTLSTSKLLDEVEALKERNKHMEGELKEMQERYSDISLKFAEVEGERQQLVMTLRNLKNGKKH